MPGDGGASAIGRVAVNGMVGAFTVEMATRTLEVPNQIAPFHPTGTSMEMVSHMAPPGASLRAFSR